jgi:hypothetical protein
MINCFEESECGNNLNGSQSDRLTEDTTATINVTTSSTVILPANTNRRLLKLYLISMSSSTTELWIRYGSGASVTNSAHILPLQHLLIVDPSQVANAISAICSTGSAQLRVSAANAL